MTSRFFALSPRRRGVDVGSCSFTNPQGKFANDLVANPSAKSYGIVAYHGNEIVMLLKCGQFIISSISETSIHNIKSG